jgi:hypothetical protein
VYIALDLFMRNLLVTLTYAGYANILTLPAVLLSAYFLRSRVANVWTSTRLTGSRSAKWIGTIMVAGSLAGIFGKEQVLEIVGMLFTALGKSQQFDSVANRLGFHLLNGFFFTLATGMFLAVQGIGGRIAIGKRGRKYSFNLATAACLFIILSSLNKTTVVTDIRRDRVTPLKTMANEVLDNRQPVYFTGVQVAKALNFFTGYESNFRYHRNRWESIPAKTTGSIEFRELPLDPERIPPNSFVVLDRIPLRRVRAGAPTSQDILPLPDYLDNPPADWVVLFDSDNYTLYDVQR